MVTGKFHWLFIIELKKNKRGMHIHLIIIITIIVRAIKNGEMEVNSTNN